MNKGALWNTIQKALQDGGNQDYFMNKSTLWNTIQVLGQIGIDYIAVASAD